MAVVEAAPGAGKTTRIPPALLSSPWLAEGRILVMEPRRLAAKSAARYVASQLGEEVGRSIGYRVRNDSRVSAQTRIEFMTEGLFLRILQADPTLDGVGALIFDEIHERNLDADLGLALALQLREELRPELRILLMSATLDGKAVASWLGDAPHILSEGRQYPVETHWLELPPPEDPRRQLPQLLSREISRILREEPQGDMLVFLPGVAEIERCAQRLAPSLGPGDRIHRLHGSLPSGAQDKLLRPSPDGERKIILATSIAESSITIPGVRIVVDGGWMRGPRYSPRQGMTRLETHPVSRDRADQRRGRAGREAPGKCWRMWTKSEEARRPTEAPAEILEADLAGLALNLAHLGIVDPSELRWLNPPPPPAFQAARTLLEGLGALGPDGKIHERGRRILALPLHPRVANMVLRAEELGMGALGCEVAALLGERDRFRISSCDLRLRLDRMRRGGPPGSPERELNEAARQIAQRAGLPAGRSTAEEGEACGQLVALAFPDRVGEPKGQGKVRLSGGLPVELRGEEFELASADYLAVAEVDARTGGRIYLAAPLSRAELRSALGESIRKERRLVFAKGSFRWQECEFLYALELDRKEFPAELEGEEWVAAWLGLIRERGLDILPWNDALRGLQRRLEFLTLNFPEQNWPSLQEEALLASLDEWLLPFLAGVRKLELLDLQSALEGRIGYGRLAELRRLAPLRVELPSGREAAIDWTDPRQPAVEGPLQEFFGSPAGPTVGGGAIPLQLRLLSPARRPLQITSDLTGFWAGSYREVRKEMRGRYPKWDWPEDPLLAQPTARTKRRPPA